MLTLKISKNDFLAFIDKKIKEKDSKTIGVIRKGSKFAFDEIEEASELCLDYDVTILPPKKYFQPPKEVLLKFKPGKADSYTAVNECEPITLIGVHYYDLAGIHLMDKAFTEDEKDLNYIKKRDNSLLVGMYPTKAFKERFSASVVKEELPYKVADLMLIDMGNDYVIEVVTDKGKEYIAGSGAVENTYSEENIKSAKTAVEDGQKFPIAVDECSAFLTKNEEHEVWKERGSKCFSCGSCVLVCPTCYCFDVNDEVELSLEDGQRIRRWDGCLLEEFAVCADGHNFRELKGARFRHRIFRKGKYLPEKFDNFGCIGCGRCADTCTADIANPVEIIAEIQGK
jgi:ferredoxin